jgi:hypothetical protein
MEKTCIDLKERYGDKYKIGKDPAYHAEYGPNAWTHDPWMLTLECRNGHIYPHGGEYLAAATRGRGTVSTALAKLPCVDVLQDGADGINAKFHVDDFTTVAKVMKPRRKRKLTDEQRAANLARLAPFRFRDAGDARRARMTG